MRESIEGKCGKNIVKIGSKKEYTVTKPDRILVQ